MRDFFVALALCHTVQADVKKDSSEGLDESDGVNNPLVERIQTTVYTYQVIAKCAAAVGYDTPFQMISLLCQPPDRTTVFSNLFSTLLLGIIF